MSDNRALYIEESIKNAVKRLLAGRVNEILGEAQFSIPPIEFSNYRGGSTVSPAITLSTCERTEKERIVRLDAYSLTVTFALPELASFSKSNDDDSELYCYAYASAVGRALREDRTLGGVADRAEMTGKKYREPKAEQCGEGWAVTLALRVTVEGLGNGE